MWGKYDRGWFEPFFLIPDENSAEKVIASRRKLKKIFSHIMHNLKKWVKSFAYNVEEVYSLTLFARVGHRVNVNHPVNRIC